VLNHIISAEDDLRIFDKLALEMRKNPGRGPIGWVQIFLQTKKGLIYDEGSNLVSARGREFVAQRTFNITNYNGGLRTDWRKHIVTHYGVGSGGSTITGGGVVSLLGPYICDTQLITAIDLGESGYLTEPGGITNAVKPITADGGSMVLGVQNYTGGVVSCDYYTKIKNTCIIPSGQPTSLAAGDSVKVDEAALYFVLNSAVDPDVDPPIYSDPNLFAHICFAPKWKEKESTLTIVWYILC